MGAGKQILSAVLKEIEEEAKDPTPNPNYTFIDSIINTAVHDVLGSMALKPKKPQYKPRVVASDLKPKSVLQLAKYIISNHPKYICSFEYAQTVNFFFSQTSESEIAKYLFTHNTAVNIEGFGKKKIEWNDLKQMYAVLTTVEKEKLWQEERIDAKDIPPFPQAPNGQTPVVHIDLLTQLDLPHLVVIYGVTERIRGRIKLQSNTWDYAMENLQQIIYGTKISKVGHIDKTLEKFKIAN